MSTARKTIAPPSGSHDLVGISISVIERPCSRVKIGSASNGLLLAQSRHAQCADECPLLGAKRDMDQPLLTNLDLWVHGLGVLSND